MKRVKYDTEHMKAAFVGACEAGDREVVDILLPWITRTDVNGTDRMGVTALMAALSADQYEVAGTLLDLPGHNFSLRDIQGATVLHHLLRSKSLFFFEEIVLEMRDILSEEELNKTLLKKLVECLPRLKDNMTMFKRVLDEYDIHFNNYELYGKAMSLTGVDVVLASKTIFRAGIPDSESDSDKIPSISLATAIAAGHASLIGEGLCLYEIVDMKEVLAMCRERGVEENTINKELFFALSLMIYKVCPTTWKGQVWHFDWDIFKLGLSLIDVNYVDYTWCTQGGTILERILSNFDEYIYWEDGIEAAKKVLNRADLDLSVTNNNGETALDFLKVNYNYNLTTNDELEWKKYGQSMEPDLGAQNPKSLQPVRNRSLSKKFRKELSNLAQDTQLLNLFKERQEKFRDFDFNFVQHTLLSKAIKTFRLDLVRFLVINCEVKILKSDMELWWWMCGWEIVDREWCQARDILSVTMESILKSEDE